VDSRSPITRGDAVVSVGELFKGRFEVIDDLGRDDIGGGEIGAVFEGVVFQPEDVEVLDVSQSKGEADL
jgi:hypothetical protein